MGPFRILKTEICKSRLSGNLNFPILNFQYLKKFLPTETTYIIGSGPTGVAAAKALLDAGRSVTMLDAGLSLEEASQHALTQTMSMPASEWDQKTLASFKRGSEATAEGILLKLAYGSDFPYRDGAQFI